jgi:thiamine kinase-like enzyme
MILLEKIINDNYGIKIKSINLITQHFGREMFLANTENGKYFVKTLSTDDPQDIEKVGNITEFLHNNGVKVAKLLKTNKGVYNLISNDRQIHLQEFIEGETVEINTASDWLLDKSADILGQIQKILKDYPKLPLEWGKDYFNDGYVTWAKHDRSEKLIEAKKIKDDILIFELEEQIKHFSKISTFEFDTDNMTYTNSHSDYRAGNYIVRNKELTVIDWDCAGYIPACLDVISSYTFADPICKDGNIDINRLKKYINLYAKHFSLNNYDLKIMPYVFYYWRCGCNYTPPYSGLAGTAYMPVCNLIQNLLNWLYSNADKLSAELLKG